MNSKFIQIVEGTQIQIRNFFVYQNVDRENDRVTFCSMDRLGMSMEAGS